jgi:hypothetical protein
MVTGLFSLAKLPEPAQSLITRVITPTHPAFMRDRRGILGDLFLTEDFAYALSPIGTEGLQISVVGHEEREEALRKFCEDIEEGIKIRFDGRRIRGMEFAWKPQKVHVTAYIRHRYPFVDPLYDEEPERGVVKLESTEPNYGHEDVEAAKVLVDDEIRQFILKLAQVGKIRSRDAAEIAKPEILHHLFPLDLVAEEYLLTCKQDQHTICVVPSKDHLNKDPMAPLRCSVCGRSFPEENLQVIYTLTERGKKLVAGSLWMSIWLTDLLIENGVRKEAIKWGLEANGEELDIMVEDFDSRIFLELKDREFGLGDAYPFVYRITRYGGKVGIVATMHKVSTDAQKFFKEETQRRENPIQIQYLEGLEGIRHGVAKLIEDISRLQARKLVQPYSLSAGFDLWPIVEHWINIKINRISENKGAAKVDISE